jgi:hypothetical protein
MDNRSAIQTLWRSARAGLARFKQLLSESGGADEAVFEPLRTPERRDLDDAERRVAEAWKARTLR